MSLDVYFVRHVPHAVQGKVMVGRRQGVELAPDAPQRLGWLAQRLSNIRLDRIVAGPLERVQLTARAIAQGRNLPVETDPELDEIDFGAWTGKTLAELDADPDWAVWNGDRTRAKAPGGESLAQVQARMANALERLTRRQPQGSALVVSHGDPIKLALAWLLGWGVDRIDHFDIDPGSLSWITTTDRGAKLRLLNERPE